MYAWTYTNGLSLLAKKKEKFFRSSTFWKYCIKRNPGKTIVSSIALRAILTFVVKKLCRTEAAGIRKTIFRPKLVIRNIILVFYYFAILLTIFDSINLWTARGREATPNKVHIEIQQIRSSYASKRMSVQKTARRCIKLTKINKYEKNPRCRQPNYRRFYFYV